jgi:uncharacterized RDD family membrane protein YckC
VVVSLVGIGWVMRTAAEIFQMDFIIVSAFWIAVAGVLSFLFMGVYYVFFWSLTGQTPGKMIFGVRVVSVDGGRVSIWQSIRRFVGYLISFILYLGYLWILVDDRRQGWHDKIANTLVVYAWDARPGELFRDRAPVSQETNTIVEYSD